MSYNQLIIEGYIARDAEMRFTPSGKPVCQFSIPVDSGIGEMKTTIWVKCSLWGDRAEKITKFLLKGTRVLVSGTLDPISVWEKDGKTNTGMNLSVKDIHFTGGKPAESTTVF